MQCDNSECQREFEPKQRKQRFCSNRCRNRDHKISHSKLDTTLRSGEEVLTADLLRFVAAIADGNLSHESVDREARALVLRARGFETFAPFVFVLRNLPSATIHHDPQFPDAAGPEVATPATTGGRDVVDPVATLSKPEPVYRYFVNASKPSSKTHTLKEEADGDFVFFCGSQGDSTTYQSTVKPVPADECKRCDKWRQVHEART